MLCDRFRQKGEDLDVIDGRCHAYEIADVTLSPPEHFLDRLAETVADRTALIDADFSPHAVRAGILGAGGRLVAQTSPITLAKAAKTPAELQGYRDCHLEDGIAVTDFLAWVATEVPARQGTALRRGRKLMR